MNLPFDSRAIDRWVEAVQRFRFIVIAIVLAITAFSIVYIKNHIAMSTDTADMLSEKLSWRQLDIEYGRVFTEDNDNVVIVIESTTPDQASDTAKKLYTALQADSYLLKDIYYPPGIAYFEQTAFLFMDEDELYDLADQLAAIQPFIGSLLEDKNLRGLFTMLTDALQAIEEGEEIDLEPLLREINHAMQDENYRVSWQRLISAADNNQDVYREFIITRTLEDPEEFLPGQHVVQHINTVIERLQLENEQTRIRLTGSTALDYEELRSVSEANIIAIVASFVTVTIILMFGLGSFWLFFSSILTLIFGLIATTAFAAATVGTLNLISVAFAVLYIGLGIDFAIHLCLRYREECLRNQDNLLCLRLATRQMFRSLLLCALTTAIGFYSFMPTDYQGVAELGWIAGSGMFISLIYTFTLLPALLSLREYHPLHRGRPAHEHPHLQQLSEIPYRYCKQILLVTVIIVVASLLNTRHLSFDDNTLNLQDPDNESVQTMQDLLADSDTSPWYAVLLSKNRDETRQAKKAVEQLDVVKEAIWIDDLVPADQENKLYIIDELNLLLGKLAVNNHNARIDAHARREAVKQLQAQLAQVDTARFDGQLLELKTNLQALPNNDEQRLAQLEQRLLVHLDGRIKALAAALNARQVDLNDIPTEVLSRWFKEDYYKLEIYPAEDLNNNAAMQRFVNELQAYNNKVIGSPVINVEAGKAVITAFKSAFAYALITISVLLLILIRVKADAVIILLSVLVGGVFTLGCMLLLNLPFNFANIIGLPLLLGIGVDSGIHITNRFRLEHAAGKNIFMTSSSRGVLVSSMTTICSIGNLAFSSHTGTASMGLLLTVGLISMMISTMVVLPSFLIWQAERKEKKN